MNCLRTTEIENIDILADPQNAFSILKPNILSECQADIVESRSNATTITQPIKTNGDISKNANHYNHSNSQNIPLTAQAPQANQAAPSTTTTSSTKPSTTAPSTKTSTTTTTTTDADSAPSHTRTTTASIAIAANPSQPFTQANNADKRNRMRAGQNYQPDNNDSCFHSISVDAIKDDFDFETNLALFDKDALYEQVEGHSRARPPPPQPVETSSASSFVEQQRRNNVQPTEASIAPSSFSEQPPQRYHQITLSSLFAGSAATSAVVAPATATATSTSVQLQVKYSVRFNVAYEVNSV